MLRATKVNGRRSSFHYLWCHSDSNTHGEQTMASTFTAEADFIRQLKSGYLKRIISNRASDLLTQCPKIPGGSFCPVPPYGYASRCRPFFNIQITGEIFPAGPIPSPVVTSKSGKFPSCLGPLDNFSNCKDFLLLKYSE